MILFILIILIVIVISIIISMCVCNEKFTSVKYGFQGAVPNKNDKLYVLYSMSNSPYQEWQGDLLDYTFKKTGQPGTLIRIVSEDSGYPNRKVSESSVGYTFLTPNFSKIKDIDWPVNNKPGSMKYLMDNFKFKDDSVLMFLDPDMIFTKPWVLPKIEENTVYTQRWKGYSKSYCQKNSIRPELCPDSEDDATMFPFAIRAKDLSKIVNNLAKFSTKGYLKNKEWMADMPAFVTSMDAAGLKIITVPNIGICNDWDNSNDPDAPVVHYCQAIKNSSGKEIWGKRTYKAWEPVPDPKLATNRVDKEVLTSIRGYISDNR